jgi:hypothetical protein
MNIVIKSEILSKVWWYMPITPVHGRLRQEDFKFEANMGYIVSLRSDWATQ